MTTGSSRHPVRRPVQGLRHSPSEERRMHGRNLDLKPYKIAILWRGDAEARQAATPQNNRFYRIFEELGTVGIHAEPAVYDEEFADEVREQLLAADGVLVWVDPIHQGKTRAALDPFLRDVASRGPWVSAHPDIILKMSCTKQSISAGVPTRTFTAPAPSSVRRSRGGCNRQARESSSRTGVTAARGFGKSSKCRRAPALRTPCVSCMRNGAASLRICRFKNSWHFASPISPGAGASSISRFSRACRTE